MCIRDRPYGVIHRIASSGKVGGVFSACLEWCSRYVDNIRIEMCIRDSISAASATGMGYSNSLRVQPVVTPLRVMNALFPEIRMRTVLSLSIEVYPCL